MTVSLKVICHENPLMVVIHGLHAACKREDKLCSMESKLDTYGLIQEGALTEEMHRNLVV